MLADTAATTPWFARCQTAGRAVVFSGTTVAIGLLAMVVLPLPFLRSIGFAGMLIPLVSVVVAVTLLPVVLSRFGDRLDWPHIRNDQQASKSWTGWATLVVRRRWVAAVGAALVLAALVLAATSLRPGSPNLNTLSRQGDARTGLLALERSGDRLGCTRANRGTHGERPAGADRRRGDAPRARGPRSVRG